MKPLHCIQLILFFIAAFPLLIQAANEDPCRGKQMLLNLVNRPSLSDSACTVPPNNLLLETGAQYQNVIGGGYLVNGPNANFRLGLTNNSEFNYLPPNLIYTSLLPHSGTSPSWVALKGRFYYDKNSVISGEIAISPPSGSDAFGSPNNEGLVNAMFFKNINKKWSHQLQLGVSYVCESKLNGGDCFQSFNPIYLLNYNVTEKIAAYYEAALQTKTQILDRSGMINGIGLLYLFRPTLLFDVEYYHRVYGRIGNMNDFYGVGISKLFR